MSSILQSPGRIKKRGAEIFLQQRNADRTYVRIDCPVCGGEHDKLWRIWRKPVGTFGHWVEFRINGDLRVPDLSLPMIVKPSEPRRLSELSYMPRDAKELSPEEIHDYWTS